MAHRHRAQSAGPVGAHVVAAATESHEPPFPASRSSRQPNSGGAIHSRRAGRRDRTGPNALASSAVGAFRAWSKMRRLNAAAFAPKALRRASPELGEHRTERRRELAEHAEKSLGIAPLQPLRSLR